MARQAIGLRRRGPALKRSRTTLALALGLAAASPAFAHKAPNSEVRLTFSDRFVLAEVVVPVSELGFTTIAEPMEASFPAYLLQHLALESRDGARWTAEWLETRSTLYQEHDCLVARVRFTPPKGTSARRFVLVDDAVTHEVRNHYVAVLASQGSTTLDDADAAAPLWLGLLQYPARRLAIERPR